MVVWGPEEGPEAGSVVGWCVSTPGRGAWELMENLVVRAEAGCGLPKRETEKWVERMREAFEEAERDGLPGRVPW